MQNDDLPGQWSVNRRDLMKQAAATVSLAAMAATGPAATAPAFAKDGENPLGGQPEKGAKRSVKDFDYQIKYQRAFEAVLWNMPAIAIYSFRRAAISDLGMKDNDIIAYSAVATPKLEAITANSTTPYISAFTDLQKGPVVLDVPAAGPDGSLYGQVVDAWQITIADVGPAGIDQGKGGKLLFTPPGYADAIPDGYIQVASPNYRTRLCLPLESRRQASPQPMRTPMPSGCECIISARQPTRRNRNSSIRSINATRPCRFMTSGISRTCMTSSASSLCGSMTRS